MSIDQIMIQCGAPSLCKIKPANMFSIQMNICSIEQMSKWKKEFAAQGINFSLLRSSENSFLVFVYNFAWIQALLKDRRINNYLKNKNYPVQEGAKAVLNELLFRLNQASAKNGSSFPHEVGIFLGYPLLDVAAFERSCGQGEAERGIWKSYTDSSEARRTWALYKECANFCVEHYKVGLKVPQIVNSFNKAFNAK
ncbi:MAG: DUF3793 family protein [Treponema sp.]|nr:DUF3793 family protein [Treponema sp.]